MRERKYLDCFAMTNRQCAQSQHCNIAKRLALFCAVMGPGLITAFADNDAGGIATYITAGAQYGYGLLFVLLVSTVFLAVAQEISARTGAVTGKGLFELINLRYGKKYSLLLLCILLIANIGTTVSEFSGIAIACNIFAIDAKVAVPIAALSIWFLVIKANYSWVEKIFFALCTTFFAYIISGIMANPPWQEVFYTMLVPTIPNDSGFLLMAMGIIGTTITPWGQFYIQAAVVDKGLSAKNYRYIVADVAVGTFFTAVVAFFIIVGAAVMLYGNGYPADNIQAAAAALEPLAGVYAKWLFAGGLLGASLLAAIILPLSTAYAVCEALGYAHGINKKYPDAPYFFQIYTGLIVVGAGLVLMPQLSLYYVMLTTQILNGVLLSPILIFMLLIANDQTLLGEYKNPRWYNCLAWAFTIILILLTILLVWSDFSMVYRLL